MEGNTRIVNHDAHLLLPDHITSKVFLELYRSLQRHAEIAGLVVALEKFIWRMNLINILPTTSIVRLQEGREAHVVEDLLPVQGKDQVSHGLVRGSRRVLVMRQQNRGRDSNAELAG